MFGFGKKQEFVLVAPLSGGVLPINKVPDQVFSAKMLGDGVAIEPGNGCMTADGAVSAQSAVAECTTADSTVSNECTRTNTGSVILVVAPCDGELTYVPDTRHAFAMTGPFGLEVLVHIGLDTVNLKGEGFKLLKEQGSQVKAGEPIIEVDLDVLKAHNLPAVTPLVLTNMDQIAKLEIHNLSTAEAGKTVLIKGVVK